jgi:hypothetical protein
MARITPARCRRWWGLGVPSVERSRCRQGDERSAKRRRGGTDVRSTGAEAVRRRQRASRPPSDSQTAVWADSARVGWRRVFRAGDDRRPASRWRLGAAAVRGRRVVRIVVTVGYPEAGGNAKPARRRMDRTGERRRCATVPGWVPSGTADPPPPAKGLHAEVASARTLRASGLTWRPLHPRSRRRRAADRGRHDAAHPLLVFGRSWCAA